MMEGLSFSKKPFPLKPSQPAAVHQLSYSCVAEGHLRKEQEVRQHSNLLLQVQELSKFIQEQETAIEEQKNYYMKSILMLSLEIQHQQEITANYDSQLRKVEETKKSLDNYYQSKLEALKKELIQGFTEQLQMEKEKANEDLKQLKENYVTKISLLSQDKKHQELQFQQKEHLTDNFQIKIDLLENQLMEKNR